MGGFEVGHSEGPSPCSRRSLWLGEQTQEKIQETFQNITSGVKTQPTLRDGFVLFLVLCRQLLFPPEWAKGSKHFHQRQIGKSQLNAEKSPLICDICSHCGISNVAVPVSC